MLHLPDIITIDGREEIHDISTIINHFTPKMIDLSDIKECVICSELFNQNEYNILLDHYCTSCSECSIKWIETQILLNMNPLNIKCACLKIIDFNSIIKSNLSEKTKSLFEKNTIQTQLKSLGFIHCPKPNCQGGIFYDSMLSFIPCGVCKTFICQNCKQIYHHGFTCEEWTIISNKPIQEIKSLEWINQMTKKCPRCFMAIEKNGGCDHIKCSCGYDFCFRCGEEYIPGHLRKYHPEPKNNIHVNYKNVQELSTVQQKFSQYYKKNFSFLQKLPPIRKNIIPVKNTIKKQ